MPTIFNCSKAMVSEIRIVRQTHFCSFPSSTKLIDQWQTTPWPVLFLDDCTSIYAGWTTHNHTVQWESPDWPSIKPAFQNLPRICVQNPTFTNHETGLATHYGQEASRASRPLPGQQGAIWCGLGARCGWVLFPPSWAASKEGWKKN